jgi:hypothetical protein
VSDFEAMMDFDSDESDTAAAIEKAKHRKRKQTKKPGDYMYIHCKTTKKYRKGSLPVLCMPQLLLGHNLIIGFL